MQSLLTNSPNSFISNLNQHQHQHQDNIPPRPMTSTNVMSNHNIATTNNPSTNRPYSAQTTNIRKRRESSSANASAYMNNQLNTNHQYSKYRQEALKQLTQQQEAYQKKLNLYNHNKHI